jgi:hypothetical protein
MNASLNNRTHETDHFLPPTQQLPEIKQQEGNRDHSAPSNADARNVLHCTLHFHTHLGIHGDQTQGQSYYCDYAPRSIRGMEIKPYVLINLNYMEMNCQIHDPAAISPGTDTSIKIKLSCPLRGNTGLLNRHYSRRLGELQMQFACRS